MEPIQVVSCDYSLDKPVDFYADPEDSSVESTTIHWKKSKTADERSMESFNERFRTFLECRLQSSSSSKGSSNQPNSTVNSPSLLLNAARNEIDVLLDLLTNVLDLGNIQLVDSSSTNEESSSISTSRSEITQIYQQLTWNSRIRQREFRNLHLELEKFHLEAVSSLKARQSSFGKLFQLKKGTQRWRFRSKFLQNTPQLYLDYGYSAMGGLHEGLALVVVSMNTQAKHLANESEFEFTFPVVHRQKLKKIKLSVGFSGNERKACSFQQQQENQCEFQYPSLSNEDDDFERSLQLQMLSLLSQEAFQMFKCSAKELGIDAFASESEQFTVCLPSSDECLTTLSIALQEQQQQHEHNPTFSRLELFALKVVLQIFLHQQPKKE